VGADDVAAIVPCHREPPAEELLQRLAAEVAGVLVVLDGTPGDEAEVRRRAESAGAGLLALEAWGGKGSAIAAGIETLRSGQPRQAVIVVDADGQHPPEAIPRFLEAASEAELVIGNRFAGPGRIPVVRRAANRTASRIVGLTSRTTVPDSQCGMRLIRGRALSAVPVPPGGMDSETRHLKRCLRAGIRVTWIPIPAIYRGQPSSFRALRDSVAVMRAAITG
jgi:glycosyltransferase involved in cell wall biosynthesis